MITGNITLLAPYMTNDQVAGFLGLDPQAVGLALGDRPAPSPTLLLQLLEKVQSLTDAAKTAVIVRSDDPHLERLCMKVSEGFPAYGSGVWRGNPRIDSMRIESLLNAGYTYLWQLATVPTSELVKIHGIKNTAYRIKPYVMGYRYGDDDPDYDPTGELYDEMKNSVMDENDPRIQAARLITTGR